MNTHIQYLQEYLIKKPIQYDHSDAQTLLDVLYDSYTSNNPIDSQRIRQYFKTVDEILSQLTLHENNQIFEITLALCEEHTRLSFLAGVHVGFLLNTELSASLPL